MSIVAETGKVLSKESGSKIGRKGIQKPIASKFEKCLEI
jgi:hypothetical protein